MPPVSGDGSQGGAEGEDASAAMRSANWRAIGSPAGYATTRAARTLAMAIVQVESPSHQKGGVAPPRVRGDRVAGQGVAGADRRCHRGRVGARDCEHVRAVPGQRVAEIVAGLHAVREHLRIAREDHVGSPAGAAGEAGIEHIAHVGARSRERVEDVGGRRRGASVLFIPQPRSIAPATNGWGSTTMSVSAPGAVVSATKQPERLAADKTDAVDAPGKPTVARRSAGVDDVPALAQAASVVTVATISERASGGRVATAEGIVFSKYVRPACRASAEPSRKGKRPRQGLWGPLECGYPRAPRTRSEEP